MLHKRRGPFLWLFLAFGANVVAIIAAAFMLSGNYAGQEAARALMVFTIITVLLVPLLLLAVWKIIDLRVLRSVGDLAVEIRAIVHGDNRYGVDADKFAALAPLPEAVGELGARLKEARLQFAEALGAATARAEEQSSRLAAILNDLHEGVVVCNLKHQVVLYNQVALRLLHVTGEVGLGRSLFNMVAREPVLHVHDMLIHRPDSVERSAPFLAGTTDGRFLLQGRMTLIQAQGQVTTGYVITFNDVTAQIAALGKRDALLRDVTEGLKAPLRRLTAGAGDVETVMRETAAIADCVARVGEGYRRVVAGWWPMSDVHSADLIDFVIHRLDGVGVTITMTGLPVWLHGDSHSIVLALDALIRQIHGGTGAQSFDMAAGAEEHGAWLDLIWEGETVPEPTIEQWLSQPVSASLGGMTVRDILQHHNSDRLSQTNSHGYVWLRIPMIPGREAHDVPRALPESRPEFFDFDLLHQAQDTGGMGGTPLRSLTYVVFDTETTGLAPSQGDQIVSVAGVRIVNGRILTGESFNRIVNPGRPIPQESIKFHGITDEMVQDKPPLAVVLPQFRAFSENAVLVAHNAAFDLKFIRMRERECGVVFDNPVLDTMLLSAWIDGTPANQSLDAIAERYGIAVTDRHTALGDSLVTAAILIRLIEALEARGIHTLDQAVDTLNITMELHQRQSVL